MIRIRRGTVATIRERHAGLLEMEVEVDGERAIALAYPGLVGPVRAGDTVILNTTALRLGLGTGGAHLVIAVEGAEAGDEPPGRGMKLRYTPVQVALAPVEETHREAVDAVESLGGRPVVIAGLHSALAPALLAARATAPDRRIAYVMTEGGALPLALSDQVPALRQAGLLDVTITAGHAFGGDLEAVTLFGALAAAASVAAADLTVVAMGPGNIGTSSRWGFGLLEVAAIVNAVAALGGRPVVAPRISFADPRPRHRGVSHHTRTALAVALARAEVVLPSLAPERARLVDEQLRDAGAAGRHTVLTVELGEVEELLAASPVPLHSMGRGFADDPDYFRTPAAAAIHATRLLA